MNADGPIERLQTSIGTCHMVAIAIGTDDSYSFIEGHWTLISQLMQQEQLSSHAIKLFSTNHNV